jgi:PIN domain nuclease of toxin-antitoxin system
VSVFDSSAILAYLQNEAGSATVRERLHEGGAIGAATWAEIAQKVQRLGDWRTARGLLLSYPVTIEPVTVADAELAAALWEPGSGLSLADRLCLALGRRLGSPVFTADTAWRTHEGVRLIR